MSLQFTQITDLIDRNCHSNTVSYPLADKTADINIALDKALVAIFKSGGKWLFDDSNHTDYPIITTALVSGQRDYTFTTDEQGNLILDIYKVVIKNTDGVYFEIYPVDQKSDEYTQGFWSGLNQTGIPSRYSKTANGIFLDCIPNYNSVAGIKIFIDREGSYFTVSDTTKKPGFAGLFHEYLALDPSVRYCKRNKMFDLSDRYERDLAQMELNMKQHYRDRSRDEVPVITSQTINSI
jgi:hypothetical protein